jgi:adenylate cyclase
VPERVERRLTTILAADVAEYSRLMRADEDATLAALTDCRAIVDRLIAEHRGRIANTAGDSVLAEFPSVADGLSCALAIQAAIEKHNQPASPDRQMRLRIGLHLGDVMTRNGDLFGDAVNIAARLEGLAEPGGICVSAAVREHVGKRVAAAFIDAGAQQVKNIAQPVHVFRVAATGPTQPNELPAALPLPDKPSVAVLPFTNMSGDPEQEFFAGGIAEDVITALSRYPSLFVIARNSSFTYKGRAVDVKQVGRELGVRYVLEGSLRKAGNRIRVSAQLVEAETGKHVWAERYDSDIADIFAMQDEITEAVTIAIAPAIAHAERQRAMRKPPESLDAWAAYQRGLWHLSHVTAGENALAEKFFRQSIELDPTFAGGHTGLAYALANAGNTFQQMDFNEAMGAAEASARRAVALDATDAEAHAVLGGTLAGRGNLAGALIEAEHARSLSPNLASAHGTLSMLLIYSGRAREGIAAHQTCARLDPRDPRLGWRLHRVALGHYFISEYAAARDAAELAISAYPEFPTPYRVLAAALGQLGQSEEAKRALDRAISLRPAAFEWFMRQRPPGFRPEDYEHVLEGLRKAGWQG